jgi:hypothetical protein
MHGPPAATADLAVLPGVLGSRDGVSRIMRAGEVTAPEELPHDSALHPSANGTDLGA